MKVVQLSCEDYKKHLKNVEMQYNQMEFCEFNKQKVEKVHYLLLLDEKKERFVIPFGERESCLFAPFSASFCLPGEISKTTSAEHYLQAAKALTEYAKALEIKKIRITFPPFLYDSKKVSYWLNAAFLSGWKMTGFDLNYALDLRRIHNVGYQKIIATNARRNLRIAHEQSVRFYCCRLEKDFKMAYEVIRTNRECKGYPLKMSYEQVEWTRQFVKGEWFSVIEGEIWVAAAVVFPVTKRVAQVIYWGDIPNNTCRPVNFLAEQLVNYYLDKGYDYLDIGPSTENSRPNYGLISFKESIGCEIGSKVTMEIKFGRNK